MNDLYNKNIYYVIMRWNAEDDTFCDMEAYRSEGRALFRKGILENDEKRDMRDFKRPQKYYYFISTFDGKLLMTMQQQRYDKKTSEAREYVLSQYNGEYLSYCKSMVRSLACHLVACTASELAYMERHGSTLSTATLDYGMGINVWCEARFFSSGAVWLYVIQQSGEHDKNEKRVMKFDSWGVLAHWLEDEEQAAKTLEQGLIDICVGDYTQILQLPIE